jgi:ferredoxin
MFCEQKEVIAITDAIVGMEGNGPTGGTPRTIGCLLTSRNPFASDLLAEKILGFEGTVPMVRTAAERGYMPCSVSELNVVGVNPEKVMMHDFVEPDSTKGGGSLLTYFTSGKWGNVFAPKPNINLGLCKGCGECAASCPQHTIEMRKKNGRKHAHIVRKNCIRCFCCQELCPFVAIDTKKNFILNIITKFS